MKLPVITSSYRIMGAMCGEDRVRIKVTMVRLRVPYSGDLTDYGKLTPTFDNPTMVN